MIRNWHIDITSSICGCTVTRTAVAAHMADMVRKPSEGGQSTTTTSYRSATLRSAWSIRVKNRPSGPSPPSNAFGVSCSNSMSSRLPGTRSRLEK